MVGPGPRDTQVLEVVGPNPTESFCWALVPQVCSDLPRNREQPGAAYGSLALFLSAQAWRQTPDFNPFNYGNATGTVTTVTPQVL